MSHKPSTQPKAFKPPDCVAAMAEIESDLLQLARGLTELQFHAPGKTGGWSIGFCLEHLVLTGYAVLPKWDAALERISVLLVAAVHSLDRGAVLSAKIKIAQVATPTSRRPIDERLRRFSMMHKESSRRIEWTVATNGAEMPVQSPFASWVRYPLGFSIDLALAHERRHLW